MGVKGEGFSGISTKDTWTKQGGWDWGGRWGWLGWGEWWSEMETTVLEQQKKS